jgi:predicted PurR-regulated permease PerM
LIAVTVFFGTIFALLNPKPIVGAMLALVPERHSDVAVRILRRFALFVPRWALTTGIAMCTVGLLVFLATWPLFGPADALVLGFTAAMFEAIPYLGPVLSAIPALLLALGAGGLTPLWVALIYLTIQLLEHNVIAPVIVAGRLQLHPVAVMFSMLLSVAVFGILGVILAVPAAGAIRILYDELYRPHLLPGVSSKNLDRLAETVLAANNHAKHDEVTALPARPRAAH